MEAARLPRRGGVARPGQHDAGRDAVRPTISPTHLAGGRRVHGHEGQQHRLHHEGIRRPLVVARWG